MLTEKEVLDYNKEENGEKIDRGLGGKKLQLSIILFPPLEKGERVLGLIPPSPKFKLNQ